MFSSKNGKALLTKIRPPVLVTGDFIGVRRQGQNFRVHVPNSKILDFGGGG